MEIIQLPAGGVSSDKISLKQKLLKPSMIIGLVVIAVIILFLLNNYRLEKLHTQTPSKVLGQTTAIIEQVGKVIDLPKDEAPIVYNVANKTKLNNEPFFEKSQNGDVVLIYSKSKLVILFRPKLNKIIQVGSIPGPTTAPVSISNPKSTPTPTAILVPTSSPTPSPTIQLSPTVKP